MKRTDAEVEEAARRFETLADELDPETASVEDLADLRAIAEAAERARRDGGRSPHHLHVFFILLAHQRVAVL
jgi:hypothetical protein